MAQAKNKKIWSTSRNLFASAMFLEMFTRRSRSGVAGSQKTAAAKPQSNKLPLLGKSLSLYSSFEESGFTTPSERALRPWMDEWKRKSSITVGWVVGKKSRVAFMNERVRLSATFNQLVGGLRPCGAERRLQVMCHQPAAVNQISRSINQKAISSIHNFFCAGWLCVKSINQQRRRKIRRSDEPQRHEFFIDWIKDFKNGRKRLFN